MQTRMGVAPAALPPLLPPTLARAAPIPYLAWEVSQQLLETRLLYQRRASVQPPLGLAAPRAAVRPCCAPPRQRPASLQVGDMVQ